MRISLGDVANIHQDNNTRKVLSLVSSILLALTNIPKVLMANICDGTALLPW